MHDNHVDHGSNSCSRSDSGVVLVGAGRAEIEFSFENTNVEGDETFSTDCGVFSCEEGEAFQIDLEEAERILVEGRVKSFSRADDDSEATKDTITFCVAGTAAERTSAARSFVIAFAEWLQEEIGGEDEYGVGLGWRADDVAAAVCKMKTKKARVL